MRGRRIIFGNRVCEFRGRRSVSLICKRCKTKVNPLRRSCVSKRSRCGAVRTCLELGEPSAEIVRVEALSLWRRANVSCARRTLCEDCACRSALAVAPCECVLSSANPLRRLCVSKRSRCGAVRMCLALGEPSAEILRVEALLLWRRANASCSRRTLCGDPGALAVAPFGFSVFFACEAVFGSCLVVCTSAFTLARCLGFHLLGPRQLRLEHSTF